MTEATVPAAVPVVATRKSVVSTPVTASLKVTVKSTDAAFVGFAEARTMEETTGYGTEMVSPKPVVTVPRPDIKALPNHEVPSPTVMAEAV